jgi:pSer/pThr/pTyr-binding forkhead associated (FHA) protein
MDVRLVYFGANGQRREVHLHEGVVSLGRAEECQLRIPAETVSRRHCQVEVSAKEIVLTDMGSSNGTLVNDKKVIDDDIILKAGDRITVGPATFTVQIDGKPGKVARAQEAKPPEPTVDAEVEEALSGSSLADEEFDPFSMLQEITDDDLDEEEEEDDIPPQPKQAIIPRGKSEGERKGPGGSATPKDQREQEKPGPKGKGKA